jgi:hypothetical protein
MGINGASILFALRLVACIIDLSFLLLIVCLFVRVVSVSVNAKHKCSVQCKVVVS